MERETKPAPTISVEERKYLSKHSKFAFYGICMLSELRKTGLSLKEVYLDVCDVPGNDEHIPFWTEAMIFLARNADHFGIQKDRVSAQ